MNNETITQKRIMNGIFIFAVLLFFTTAAVMRFVDIGTRPGYEWDEPYYATVANFFHQTGGLNMPPESGALPELQAYHPPFDTLLRSAWISVTHDGSIPSLRRFSVTASLLTYLVLFLLVWRTSGKITSLLVLALVVTDGWLNYTNRLVLMENLQMLLIATAMLCYSQAEHSRRPRWFIVTGICMGLAVIYKHTAGSLLVVPVVMAVMDRATWRNHARVLITMLVVMIVYLISMYALFGPQFVEETMVQIGRATGSIPSHGLNFDLKTTFQAIFDTYWVFVSTVGVLILAGPMMLVTLIRLRRGTLGTERLYAAWYLSGVLFMVVVALKAPHYLILTLVPAYLVVGDALIRVIRKAPYLTNILSILMTVVVILNLWTWYARFMAFVPDNALALSESYFASLPGNPKVLTEDAIGYLLPKKVYWLNIQQHQVDDATELQARIDYVVFYSTITQSPPNTYTINQLKANCTVVQEFKGFKEKIQICRVNKPPAPRATKMIPID